MLRTTMSEYLSSDLSPDVDFVDGELVDRNVGDAVHGRLQFRLAGILGRSEHRWRVRGALSLRLRVRPECIRVADVALLTHIEAPPLLCVEILSPEDRMTRMQQKIADYLDFGVRAVWVIDPEARTGLVCTTDGMKPAADGILRVPGTPIEVPLNELWD